MQCHGALKRPLRSIIKSIGISTCPHPRAKHGSSHDFARDHSRTTGSKSQDRRTSRDGHQSREADERRPGPQTESVHLAREGVHRLGPRALHSGKHRSQSQRSLRSAHPFRNYSAHRPCQGDRTPGTAIKSEKSAETGEASATGQCERHAHHSDDGEAMIVRRVAWHIDEDRDQAAFDVTVKQFETDSSEDGGAVKARRVLSDPPSHIDEANHNEIFDDIVEQAKSGPNDARLRMKRDDQLTSTYFAAYRTSQQIRLGKSYGRWNKQKQRHQQPSSDDWRKVLHLLEDATPSGEEHFKKIMEVVDLPNDLSIGFKGNAGATILDIMQRTGCHVQIGSSVLDHHSSGDTKEFKVSINLLGTPQENSAALKILPQYFHVSGRKNGTGTNELRDLSIRSPDKAYWDEQDTLSDAELEKLDSVVDLITSSTAVPVRSDWAQDRFHRQPTFSPARFIRREKFWTTTKLTEYIKRLTRKRPRLVMRSIYRHEQHTGSHVGHIGIVTEELEALLTDQVVTKALSATSLNLALRYLVKHSKLHVFRKVFAFLEHEGYKFAASNWNVLLAGAAKAGDVYNFRYVLQPMLDRKVPPTAVTWALFHDLMSRRFPLEAGIVVETMRRKGMLVSNQACNLIAANSVGYELTAHLATNRDLESFHRVYDNRFGLSYGRPDFEWLSLNVANRMCGVLLAAGRVQDAFSVLQDYKKRRGARRLRAVLETRTLNIFLTSALRDRDPATAIAILQRFRVSQPGAIVPDEATYTILFSLAWRQKHYNMLRVVWRYACAAGHVDHAMQSKIETSMLFQLPKDLCVKEVGAMRQLWMSFAAKFAVGLDEQKGTDPLQSAETPEPAVSSTAPDQNLSNFETVLVRLASQSQVEQDSREHDNLRQEVKGIVEQDFAQLHKLKPVLALPDVLEQALIKDQEWQSRGIARPQGVLAAGGIRQLFTEMLQEGVKIPTISGDYTTEDRPWEVPSVLFDKRVNDRA